MKKTLLWQNESVTSTFTAQTVSVPNISNYNVLIFIISAIRTNTRTRTNCVLLATDEYDGVQQYTNSFYGPYSRRARIDLASDEVHFYAGSDGSINNDVCIPYEIYGIE